MHWQPPAAFDDFELIRRIGTGGMGTVYLAQDTVLGRQVAIKFVSQTAADPAAAARFALEARAIARLHHPNVVAVYRVGGVGGCPYMDADPAGHLDAVFALAERHGCDVDLHLDFTDDAGASQLALVVERTAAHAMGGHVTVGHCTTLAAMDPTRQRAAL